MPLPGQTHFLYLAAGVSDEARQVLRVRDRYVIGLPSPGPHTDGGEENVLALMSFKHIHM